MGAGGRPGWTLLTRGCLARSSISAVWFRASSAPQATASLARVKLRRVFAQGPCSTSPKAATNSSNRLCSVETAQLQTRIPSPKATITPSPEFLPSFPPYPRPLTGERLRQQQEDRDTDLAGEPHAQAKEGSQSDRGHQAAKGAVTLHYKFQEPVGCGQGQTHGKAAGTSDHSPCRAGLLPREPFSLSFDHGCWDPNARVSPGEAWRFFRFYGSGILRRVLRFCRLVPWACRRTHHYPVVLRAHRVEELKDAG